MNWKKPIKDTHIVTAVENEWKHKGKEVVSLCTNRDTVVQAGGNIGIFPYYLSDYFNKVITFEPILGNYNCLLHNLEGKNNIITFNLGLGDKEEEAGIKYNPEDNCGAISLGAGSGIHVCTLDSLKLESLDLLWLDIEGYEAKALLGAKNTIEKFSPILVLENKGLIPGFGGTLQGSNEFRAWVEDTFNYRLYKRLMRDDIFIRNT